VRSRAWAWPPPGEARRLVPLGGGALAGRAADVVSLDEVVVTAQVGERYSPLVTEQRLP
jgi:hypothetical protein